MKRPGRRHARLLQQKLRLTLAAAGWLMLPEAAVAQSCGFDPGTTCTTPFQGQVFSPSPQSKTLAGSVIITTLPTASFLGAVEVIANGLPGATVSSGSNAGNAAETGSLTLQSSAGFTHTLPQLLVTRNIANTLYGASIGGNGGNYTGDDGRHNAGTATPAQSATLTNTGPITVLSDGAPGSAGQLVAGAALLVDSIGGKGGNVANLGPDRNDNPNYGGATGTDGANGGSATLVNSGAISVSLPAPLVSLGYWGAAARSMGGDGGAGQDGTAGAAAGTATLTNTASVAVSLTWGSNAGGPATFPPAQGAFAVHARSQGGNGSQSVQSGYDGGAGGAGGSVSMTIGNVSASGIVTPITISLDTTNPSNRTDLPLSAAIGAVTLGGNGGAGYDSSTGGAGGSGGMISLTVLDGVTVRATGDGTIGILAQALGGVGGTNGLAQDNSAAGVGGSSGWHADTTPFVQVTTTNTVVSTTGALAHGIMAATLGGAGGGPNSEYTQPGQPNANSSPGGGGGNTGPVLLTVTGGNITTTGPQAMGVAAQAQGGAGSAGADLNAGGGSSGAGGSGGQGSPVTLSISGGTTISTSGAPTSTLELRNRPAFGVYAASIGGAGGKGGVFNPDGGGTRGNGGDGGGGYDVALSVAQGVTVNTAGTGASAVVAVSLGGAGGNAAPNSSGTTKLTDGNGGQGGDSGNVTVTSGANLTTQGSFAHGIIAQSTGGVGGNGANGASAFGGTAGNAGGAGTPGSSSVTHTGTIATGGSSALGILAQSIGGGSGNAGSDEGGFVAIGGSAAAAANGGAVTVTQSGGVSTRGTYALGILAQSIGGGGGSGGTANGVFASIGGTGGGGGAGGAATVALGGGTVATLGRLAHGVVAQSIGGGGGNGGDAQAASAGGALAIGGAGAGGGTGGTVTLNATGGTITTTGGNSVGLMGQSIGGGGGSGGSAYAVTGSTGFSAAVGIGGSGAGGGSAGNVTATLAGLTISTAQGMTSGSTPTNLNPADAHGILLQSIGNGGGIGGSASAQAVAFGVPVPGSGGSSVAASVTSTVGGRGGGAGDGAAVQLTLNGGSNVTTQGQGSHGLLLQSIGGSGGSGGDSSAMAATTSFGRATSQASTNAFSLEISVALGGNSGKAGMGGSVTALVDSSTVMTLGDYANAMVLHSIGGGGGNGGIGSSTSLAFGSTRNINAGIGLGGTAGLGGNGGEVSATLGPQGLLQTYGASAIGLIAQSIGGGGGVGQGGTINLGAAYAFSTGDGSGGDDPDQPSDPTATLSATTNVNLGAKGGSGGSGGTASATIQGTIRTAGSDSAGVVLQSIGGGGGIAGSAGAEASSDNPVVLGSKARTVVNDYVESNASFAFTANLTVGGGNGGSGGGGSVTYNQAATGVIATLGDWSHGVVAQSISGGGGMGGAAAAAGSIIGLTLNMAAGSTTSLGGTGGSVTFNFTEGASIATGASTTAGTTGYAAFGVLGQSIGGGGGISADGSTGSQIRMFVGAQGNGSGNSAGDGGPVTVNGTVNITTLGAVAAGMVLQSIGGGGGVGGAGNFTSIGTPTGAGFANIQVGSLFGATGNGGTVLVNNATLNISTSGAHAYGLLAQSIGGGGGFGFTANNAASISNAVGAGTPEGFNVGTGGSVTLNLSGGGIQTIGMGAHGLIAQSIGGGGGIAGLPTGAGGITTLAYGAYQGDNPSGAGGNVTINSSMPITTRGDFAYGILAQSIGGGGGMQADGAQVLVGSTNSAQAAPAVPSGGSGSVTIVQAAPINATGANSVGIFGQSVGVFNSGPVNITVSAAVQGGSGAQGLAIWSDSINTGSSIQIAPGGSVSALSGTAIRSTAGDTVNAGQVAGSYALGGGGRFLNNGALLAGPSLVASLLDNAGTVRIAAHVPHGVSAVSADFTQRASGRLTLDADFSNRRADLLTVAGAANLAGRVQPIISSVLPDVALPFMTVAGPVTGELTGAQTEIFGYMVSRKGGEFSVSANADFTPAGYNLSRNVAAVANHMQAAWDAGGAGLGPLFATLGNIADAGGQGAYSAALNQISPNANLAPGARITAAARGFAQAAMSCPQFIGTTAMLREGECVWATLTGRTASQASVDGLSGFRLNSTTWQVGGQRAMGGGWFLGGSLAFEEARLSSTGGLNNGRGQSLFGAVTGKYQTGPWLFSGAVFGGGGEFNGSRTITLPGFDSVARGSPSLAHAGAMLRATYTMGGETLYLRPSLTASLIHAASGAYRESGAGVLNLDVSSASATVGGLTPALELGGRATLGDGTVLRLFTSAGLSLLTQGRWNQESRLIAAPAGVGRFSSVVRTDQVVGRFAAGVQVFATDRLELRLQYEGEVSQNLTGHGGALAFAYRF